MKINVLTDYHGWLYFSARLLKDNKVSYDIERLKHYAAQNGIELNFLHFNEINFRQNNYQKELFLYTSSEDRNLFYKNYIEDIVLGLKQQGAVVLPDFPFLKAHHNKVFMEMCRDIYLKDIDTGIQTYHFGCLEEFLIAKNNISYPAVFKISEGASSTGVSLVKSRKEAVSNIKKESFVFSLKYIVKNIIGRLQPYSLYRRKFILQNYIEGLKGDYKVLVFGDKYYALSRENRKNDFRASGSGKLNYEPELPKEIFDFAKNIYDTLNVPILSLDIAFLDNNFYLIEFQCISFGTVTLELSTHYFIKEDSEWLKIDKKSILEEEFILTLKAYLIKNNLT